ncbi:MAG: thiamine-phosphate kinase [Desulfomonilaceae bacterium]
MKLSDIGEFGFIDRIAPLGLIRPRNVIRGIGDDCAVVRIDEETCLLVTTDLLIERVHFHRSWAPANILGRKSLAVNISDIAACGGVPKDAFISIGIPDNVAVEWLDDFYEGLTGLAREYEVNLLGGDTTRSLADIVINVAITGTAPCDETLFRDTAKPGDILALTGPTGLSAAGCDLLLRGEWPPDPWVEPLKAAHLNPRPHVREGRFLAASHACSAAIDISDGLSSDLGHICTQSKVGALIFEDKLPIHDALLEAASYLGKNPLDWALHGGEDYPLLTCVRPDAFPSLKSSAAARGIQLIAIGVIEETLGMRLQRRGGHVEALTAGGWNHFRENR